MSDVKGLLQSLGVKVVRREGEGQVLCTCPDCLKKKLYINATNGMWKCFHGCSQGNPYTLIHKMKPLLLPAEIFDVMETFGFDNDKKDAPAEEAKVKSWPRLKKEDWRPISSAELDAFCKIKNIDRGCLRNFMGDLRVYKEKCVLLPAYDPSEPDKACSLMRAALDGGLVTLANGRKDKYPGLSGSHHGLFGYHHIVKHESSKKDPLLFTEGWGDALKATELGFFAVASSGGCSCFKKEWLLFFKDRKVFLIFDKDAGGERGANRAAKAIWTVAKEVRIVSLPYPMKKDHGKDLKDYIEEGHTHKDLETLIYGAKLYQPPIEAADVDIEAMPGKRVEVPDLNADTIAKAFEEDSEYKHHYHNNDGWTMFGDNLQYQEVDGKEQISVYLSRFASRCVVRKKKSIERFAVSDGKIASVLTQVSYLPEVRLRPKQSAPCSLDGDMDTRYIIPVANGLLDWSEDAPVLRPATDQYYTVNYLPYAWEGNQDSMKWIQFLADATGGDRELFQLLQQWAGYCLMKHDQKQQKFMLLYGEGGTGKSVFEDVLTHMIGQTNISNIPLDLFNVDRHVIGTYGKMLNITEETESHIEGPIETSLKHYTGGTRYSFRRLYGEPFSAYPTAKIMIVTNHRPRFRDTSNGTWRRLILAPFETIVPENKIIRGLAEQIIETEMSGVLKWAIEGAKLLEKRGEFIMPERCRTALAEYKREALPEIEFLEENFEECEFDIIALAVPCTVFRVCYEKWCKDRGIKPKSEYKIGGTKSKMFPLCERKKGRRDNKLVWLLRGLTIKMDSEFYLQDVYSA